MKSPKDYTIDILKDIGVGLAVGSIIAFLFERTGLAETFITLGLYERKKRVG